MIMALWPSSGTSPMILALPRARGGHVPRGAAV